MGQLKGFVFVLAGLCIIVLLVSLLMPSRVMTVRSVSIHGNPISTFSEIADLKRWKDWHPVFIADSDKITISEPSFGVNAIARWTTSDKINSLMITEALAGHIKLKLSRAGENDIENILSVDHLPGNADIQVEWRVLTKLKWYPWEKFYGIFLDKLTGPGYETALNNLKRFEESKN